MHVWDQQSIICFGKPDIDLTMFRDITHRSMSFARNRAEIFNYSTLYFYRNYLNMHFWNGILKKFRSLQSTGYIKCGIRISIKLQGGKNSFVKMLQYSEKLLVLDQKYLSPEIYSKYYPLLSFKSLNRRRN